MKHGRGRRAAPTVQHATQATQSRLTAPRLKQRLRVAKDACERTMVDAQKRALDRRLLPGQEIAKVGIAAEYLA